MLTWVQQERITDRYGTVFLTDCNSLGGREADFVMDVQLVLRLLGQTGTLLVIVQVTRPSTHIGDRTRGIVPRMPKVGEQIVLGSGTLFSEGYPPCSGSLQVGVRPTDGRTADWLSPQALYRAHEQTVRLLFSPSGP